MRAELGLPEHAVLIGMMGRYHPMKDYANFLQAAALISNQYPDANFALIGQGIDDQNVELRRSIRELGLQRRTRLLGERHDIPRIAAALDVFSLSSYSESFPNVIGEAMACEVSCAVTHVGDAAWIVGDAGRVVPPRNPRALADAWSVYDNSESPATTPIASGWKNKTTVAVRDEASWADFQQTRT